MRGDLGKKLNVAATALAALAVGLIFVTAGQAGTLEWAALRDLRAVAWLLVWASPAPVSALPLLVRPPAIARGMRIVIAVLLWLCSAATFTIFFMPAAWAMAAAAGAPSPTSGE